MMVSLVLQLCMFLGIAMGKILCYDNCMMKNILKNKKFWKIICILAIIAYTAKNLFIGADTDEGYGIMVGYRLAMGDRLLLEMWEPHQTSAIFTAVFIRLFVMLTGGVNYLNLFLRLVFFPIQAGVSVFLYKTIHRTVPQMDENVAALMGLLYYVTTPKSIFIPEYSNLHNWFFALMVLCLLRYFGAKDSEGRQTAGELRWLVLAGIFMTCDVLAYPSMVLVFLCCLIFLLGLYLFLLAAGHHRLVIVAVIMGFQIGFGISDQLVDLALVFFFNCLGRCQFSLQFGLTFRFFLRGIDAVALQVIQLILDIDSFFSTVSTKFIDLRLDFPNIFIDWLAKLGFLLRRKNF